MTEHWVVIDRRTFQLAWSDTYATRQAAELALTKYRTMDDDDELIVQLWQES